MHSYFFIFLLKQFLNPLTKRYTKGPFRVSLCLIWGCFPAKNTILTATNYYTKQQENHKWQSEFFACHFFQILD